MFYLQEYNPSVTTFTLDEDTSRHIIQVLRMKMNDEVQLTDGKGTLLTAEITDDHKKHCEVRVINSESVTAADKKITIAISLLKNTSRFEWFLEKATEIGVTEIVPLICHRTEKQKFRIDRMQQILVSAMLQSKQVWLPVLAEPVKYMEYIKYQKEGEKFIAHCLETDKRSLHSSSKSQILIGPEGDFTQDEIDAAIQNGFKPVTLGDTRLRSETAGVVAAVLLSVKS
jgi:16S rRNA (uracil1498-N3)-methyltransferase